MRRYLLFVSFGALFTTLFLLFALLGSFFFLLSLLGTLGFLQCQVSMLGMTVSGVPHRLSFLRPSSLHPSCRRPSSPAVSPFTTRFLHPPRPSSRPRSSWTCPTVACRPPSSGRASVPQWARPSLRRPAQVAWLWYGRRQGTAPDCDGTALDICEGPPFVVPMTLLLSLRGCGSSSEGGDRRTSSSCRRSQRRVRRGGRARR